MRAAEAADLKPATAEAAAAADSPAKAQRDSSWMDYDRMLRDTQTYTLGQIKDVLKLSANIDISIASICRDRAALLQREAVYGLAAARARAVVQAVTDSGESDMLEAGRVVASQLIFNGLANLPALAFEDMSLSQTIALVDSLSRLSKAHVDAAKGTAETELVRARVAQMQRAFDAEIAKVRQAAPGGVVTISAERIEEMRKAVFG